jgi:hypothetical protein
LGKEKIRGPSSGLDFRGVEEKSRTDHLRSVIQPTPSNHQVLRSEPKS